MRGLQNLIRRLVMALRVKIFQNNGYEGIKSMEGHINEWLATNGEPPVIRTETALCQIANSPEGERYQNCVISVWYEG